jgi:GAF domain-containing protein
MNVNRPEFDILFPELDRLSASINNPENRVLACFDKVMDAMGAERGFMLFCRGGESEWKPFAVRGMNQDSLFVTEGVSTSIIHTVAKAKKSLITTNALADPRFADKRSVIVSEIRSVICAPLLSEHGFFGLIYMDNRFSDDFFVEKDRDYLIMCARKLSKIITYSLQEYGLSWSEELRECLAH